MKKKHRFTVTCVAQSCGAVVYSHIVTNHLVIVDRGIEYTQLGRKMWDSITLAFGPSTVTFTDVISICDTTTTHQPDLLR